MVLLFGITAQAQVFRMVKDIIPGTPGSDPRMLTDVNGMLFFAATTTAAGEELWKTNGTFAGTVLVKDIHPGATGSSLASFTNVNGILYFKANDGIHGDELWKSDGTAAGTVLVKDITPGATGSSNANFINVSGILYFTAKSKEMWKSDGTAAGTVLIKAFTPAMAFLSAVTEMNGMLYFSVTSGAIGRELWKSDGTAAGTVIVSDIYPGVQDVYVANLTRVGNIIYFRANGDPPASLWKTDGTTAGTVLVQNVGQLAFLTRLSSTLCFASWQTGNNQLWRSNGTAATTNILKQWSSPFPSFPVSLIAVNNTLFFISSEATHGAELWRSNGSVAGTVIVKDINPGATGSDITELATIDGTLFFSANDGTHGEEIWKSDGTTAGTVMVQDINIPGDGTPREFIRAGAKLYATIFTTTSGRELWAADTALIRPVAIPEPVDRREPILTLFPSPAHNSATLIIDVQATENLAYSIVDQAGKVLQQKNIVVAEGKNYLPVETSILAAGAYIIRVQGDITHAQIKFLKE
jgi:ELWxxDGT repeat protein